MRDVTRYVAAVPLSPRGVTVTLLITGKDSQPSCSGQELHHGEIRIHQSAASHVIYKLKPSFASASTKDRDTQRFSYDYAQEWPYRYSLTATYFATRARFLAL